LFRKTVLVVLLFLLIISTLTLAVRIQPVKRVFAASTGIFRIQGPYSMTTDSSTISITLGSNPAVGDVMIATVDSECNNIPPYAYVTSISETNVNWSSQVNNTYSLENIDSEIWLGVVNSSGAGIEITINLAKSADYNGAVATVCEYSGIDTSNPLDQEASASGNTFATSTGITPMTIQNDELYVGTIAFYSDSPIQTDPTNDFILVADTSIQLFDASYLEKMGTSTGNVQTGTTCGGTEYCFYCGVIATFKARSSTGNLVINGGFESGNLTGWTVESGVTPTVRSDEHYEGNYCVATSYYPGDYLPFTLSQRLPQVSTSQISEVYCWFMLGSVQDSDYFAVNYTDGSISNVTCPGPSGWTKVSITPLPGKNIDSVILQQTMSASGIACFDDVTVIATGLPFVSISPGSAILDVGQSLPFNSTVFGYTSPYAYQWYLDGAPGSGATSDSWTFTPTSSGSYTLYLNVNDSIGEIAISNTATVNVNSPPSILILPTSVTTDVGHPQTFNSTVSGGTLPDTYQWFLNGSAVPSATFSSWNFTPASVGSYMIYANVTDGVGMQATSNVATVTVNLHDVAVTDVVCSKTVVGQGFSDNITVTVANQGDYTEIFNLTIYGSILILSQNLTTPINSQNITLPNGTETAIVYAWNTTGYPYGNYTISAYALPVPGENNTANNNCTGGWIIVSIVGDVTGPNGWPDGQVDIRDVHYVAIYYGATLSSPNWNPNADINNDGKVDIRDVHLAAVNYGQHYP
jgi:hypothetical protein